MNRHTSDFNAAGSTRHFTRVLTPVRWSHLPVALNSEVPGAGSREIFCGCPLGRTIRAPMVQTRTSSDGSKNRVTGRSTISPTSRGDTADRRAGLGRKSDNRIAALPAGRGCVARSLTASLPIAEIGFDFAPREFARGCVSPPQNLPIAETFQEFQFTNPGICRWATGIQERFH